jgi:shikimate kinase
MPPMSNTIETRGAIALVGLSGAGKSTVGRLLADRLGWAFSDTDALVEQLSGRRLPAIFADSGEEAFRALETRALQVALAAAPCIVSTGGGAVLRPENRALLRASAFVVWLDAPTEELIARLRAHDEERPLLAGDDPARQLDALREARGALYAETCDLRVVTEGRPPPVIRDEVLRQFAAARKDAPRV